MEATMTFCVAAKIDPSYTANVLYSAANDLRRRSACLTSSYAYRSRGEPSSVDPNHHCQRLLLLLSIDRRPDVQIETIFTQGCHWCPDGFTCGVEELDDHLITRIGQFRGVEDRAAWPRLLGDGLAKAIVAVGRFAVWNSIEGVDTLRFNRRRLCVRRVDTKVGS